MLLVVEQYQNIADTTLHRFTTRWEITPEVAIQATSNVAWCGMANFKHIESERNKCFYRLTTMKWKQKEKNKTKMSLTDFFFVLDKITFLSVLWLSEVHIPV